MVDMTIRYNLGTGNKLQMQQISTSYLSVILTDRLIAKATWLVRQAGLAVLYSDKYFKHLNGAKLCGHRA